MSFQIIGGRFKGRILQSPKSSKTRPTQGILRESVFNICQNEIIGARFLDIFAGSGAMGLEAISRGAIHSAFVEQDPTAIHCIRKNIELLGVEKSASVLGMDFRRGLKHLAKQNETFSIIYVDPPYAKSGFIKEVLANIDPLLSDAGTLFIEERAKEPTIFPEFERMKLKKTRRFGIALLHQFDICCIE